MLPETVGEWPQMKKRNRRSHWEQELGPKSNAGTVWTWWNINSTKNRGRFSSWRGRKYCEHPPPFFLNSFSFEPSHMGLLLESGMAGLLDHLTFVGHWLHPTGVFLVDHVTGCVNLKCWNYNLLQSNMAVLMSCCVDLEPLYCLIDVDVYWSSYCKNRDIVF